ncbi:unnamed protein product [Tilletia controversa]|uniref:Oligopeptide transporter n=3 Tax=Tilletia TaxID=13289 RepID=A0A8X7SXD4_9BASI|nr:hypothetical protein CF336_g3142 [Tilletia laevis]KAE8200519.1 hypothetical protein CF328_g2941 [Tilletia controversa]KAE8264117.1 hypothetical protein A4X03_0g1175 [Tilletia caries]KAE8205566.1 hypothetical protein CF335_g2255 [Tilletia laevis]KAE8248470.1 hypothetical protein A4X06_0g3691 [Tilletia controversa]
MSHLHGPLGSREHPAGPSSDRDRDLEPARPDDDFTARAVVTGLLIGCLVAFTNLSLGLQSGWTSMMSLQSALLGFGILKFIRMPSLKNRPFSPQENAVLQATAVAVGTMPLSAGFVGIIPALNQLDPEQDGSGPIKLNTWQLLAWSFALAYFGVFFASPLRPALILKEKLPFPSGTATAQLISVLHDKPLANPDGGPAPPASSSSSASAQPRVERSSSGGQEEVGSKAGFQALLWSFGGSALFTLASFFVPVLYAIPIFDPICPGHNAAAMWGWWFTPSLSYIGQGIIMGLPTSLSMSLGAFVGWAILSPISYYTGWAPGDPLSGKDGSRGWLIWIALAIMCSESILGLVALFFANGTEDINKWLHKVSSLLASVGKNSRRVRRQQPGILDTGAEGDEGAEEEDTVEHEPPSRLTSKRTVLLGLLGSTILAVILIELTFKRDSSAPGDTKRPASPSPGSTILAILIALVLSLLGARALGQTDLNPVSGLGKISQLVFALTSPGNVVANLIAGGISEAGAMAAGDMLQDYKTGHLVGSSPHSQFKGQLVGSTLGIFVSVFAYQLYARTYELPGPQFPAPSAGVWLNLARLLNNGHLPPKSAVFMSVFAAIFAVTGILRSVARARGIKREFTSGGAAPQRTSSAKPSWEVFAAWMPSGIAFAVGILNTPNFSLARLVGGLIGYYYLRHVRQQRQGRAPDQGRYANDDDTLAEGEDDGYAGTGTAGGTPDERTGLLRRRAFADGDENEEEEEQGGPEAVTARARRTTRPRVQQASPAFEGVFIIVVASGLVLGEGAASIITLILKQYGFQPLTCFGCRGGCSSC